MDFKLMRPGIDYSNRTKPNPESNTSKKRLAHYEEKRNPALAEARRNDRFINKAMAAGFTQSQAVFLLEIYEK